MKYQIKHGTAQSQQRLFADEPMLAFFELWGVFEKMANDAHLMLHVKMNDADERGFWQRRLVRLNETMQVFVEACLFWEAGGQFDHEAAIAADRPEASAFVTRLANEPLTWQFILRDGSWGHDIVSVWPVIETETEETSA